MSNEKVLKPKFDLEQRTLSFSRRCIDICKTVEKNTINFEIIKQLVRSAGSVGANYREANDCSTRKDFYYRIGICRKEAKESKYWLELLLHSNPKFENQFKELIDEAWQLSRIFASIVLKNR